MNFDRYSPPLLSVLRIVTALLLLQHGLMKLVHFPGPQPGAPDPLTPLLLAAAVIEVIGGGLVALGLFTRVMTFVLSGEMAAAYFIGHSPHGFWAGLNGGDCGVVLFRLPLPRRRRRRAMERRCSEAEVAVSGLRDQGRWSHIMRSSARSWICLSGG
jgi:putative oxidoreductase